MSAKSELRKLSKSKLIDIILEQGKTITELMEKLKNIEALFRQYENHNTPSSQIRFKRNTRDKDEVRDASKRFPGRENGHKGAGIKIPKPDRVEEHTIDKEGYKRIGKRTQTVIDFADSPIIVTKHIIHKYRAPDDSIVEPEIDLPKGIYGKNLQAFISLLKGKLGASHEGIVDIIKSVRDDITICAATSQNITDDMAASLIGEREAIQNEIRNAFYCNCDETGLRQDGMNGYVWVFCTQSHVLYEVDLSRSKEIPRRVLGKDNDIILACDGWQGYNDYRRQRCWVHLMGELDDLTEEHESVGNIRVQSDNLHTLYQRALEAKERPPDERIKIAETLGGKSELGFIIKSLSNTRHCSGFASKLENALPHMFTGVVYPEIPLDNNHAERMLRKVVIHRKLMGGIRNEKGKRFIENTLSAMQTWRLQGKNIYETLKMFAG